MADDFDDLLTNGEKPKPASVTLEVEVDQIPFATNGLQAPTFFVDAIRGTMKTKDVCKLNLVEYRVDALTDSLVAIHVCSLVLPTSQLGAWAEFLKAQAEIGAEAGGDA